MRRRCHPEDPPMTERITQNDFISSLDADYGKKISILSQWRLLRRKGVLSTKKISFSQMID